MQQLNPRVLSIQSHVVSGAVGNKCAVFPLNRLSIEVDAINSVQFSNHTGYPSFKGQVMSGEELWTLIEGLEANDLLRYTHLLTGYIGSLSLLKTIARVAKKLRDHNPDLIYVCDPVMGDDGRLYCNPALPAAYKTDIVPLASITTPNQFEAEILTGITITSQSDALDACRILHEMGPHTVVISSLALENEKDFVTVIASTTLSQEEESASALKIKVPRIKEYFTGTGDLMTALLLAWLSKHPHNLKKALELTIAGLQAVLRNTAESYRQQVNSDVVVPTQDGNKTDIDARSSAVCRARELKLIENQDALVDPPITWTAEKL